MKLSSFNYSTWMCVVIFLSVLISVMSDPTQSHDVTSELDDEVKADKYTYLPLTPGSSPVFKETKDAALEDIVDWLKFGVEHKGIYAHHYGVVMRELGQFVENYEELQNKVNPEKPKSSWGTFISFFQSAKQTVRQKFDAKDASFINDMLEGILGKGYKKDNDVDAEFLFQPEQPLPSEVEQGLKKLFDGFSISHPSVKVSEPMEFGTEDIKVSFKDQRLTYKFSPILKTKVMQRANHMVSGKFHKLTELTSAQVTFFFRLLEELQVLRHLDAFFSILHHAISVNPSEYLPVPLDVTLLSPTPWTLAPFNFHHHKHQDDEAYTIQFAVAHDPAYRQREDPDLHADTHKVAHSFTAALAAVNVSVQSVADTAKPFLKPLMATASVFNETLCQTMDAFVDNLGIPALRYRRAPFNLSAQYLALRRNGAELVETALAPFVGSEPFAMQKVAYTDPATRLAVSLDSVAVPAITLRFQPELLASLIQEKTGSDPLLLDLFNGWHAFVQLAYTNMFRRFFDERLHIYHLVHYHGFRSLKKWAAANGGGDSTPLKTIEDSDNEENDSEAKDNEGDEESSAVDNVAGDDTIEEDGDVERMADRTTPEPRISSRWTRKRNMSSDELNNIETNNAPVPNSGDDIESGSTPGALKRRRGEEIRRGG